MPQNIAGAIIHTFEQLMGSSPLVSLNYDGLDMASGAGSFCPAVCWTGTGWPPQTPQLILATSKGSMMSPVNPGLTQESSLLHSHVLHCYNLTQIYLTKLQTLGENIAAHRQKIFASFYDLQHPVFANFC